MRVLTLNVAGGRADWPERRTPLVEGLRTLRPDVAVLQEVCVRADHDQARDLLGFAFHLARHPRAPGLTVASRWPVTATHALDLAVGPGAAGAAALLVEIDSPDGPLLVVNHFPSRPARCEAEREAQAVRVARAVQGLRPEESAAVLLAGDLAAEPGSAGVRFWTGRQSLDGCSVGYRDCWETAHPRRAGHTRRADTPGDADDRFTGRTDYLLVRRAGPDGPAWSVGSCRLVFDRPRDGIWPADHAGVQAELTHPHGDSIE